MIPARYAVLDRRRGYFARSQLRGTLAALRTGRRNWRQYLELRMWIRVRLRDRETGRELAVLTTHLSADGDLKVAQAGAIVRRALAEATPVILAGDLNVPAEHPRGRDVEAAAVLATLRNMGRAAPRDRENIDYVLARGFEPLSTTIWDEEHLPGARALSDHYAEDDVLGWA